MQTAVATGVLSSGFVRSVSADDGSEDSGDSGYDGPSIALADQLVELSTEELRQLPNEEVRRPFNPSIGGGEYYDPEEFEGADGYPHSGRVTRNDADYVTETGDELKSALASAGAGEVVWIEGDAVIDVEGWTDVGIASGVTVASNRGIDGGEGAKLYVENGEDQRATYTRALYPRNSENIRITGIRFVGPEQEYWTMEERGIDSIYELQITFPVWLYATTNAEIDNCHFSGWSYTCIRDGGWGVDTASTNTYVHHNEFVDTPSPGLGYGVTTIAGNTMIEYNYFDNNRHATAGTGQEGCSYTARNNLFGPRTRSHVIDMHESGDQAGERLVVENNVVLATGQESVKIRGTPNKQSLVRWNWFFNDGIFQLVDDIDEAPAVEQYTSSSDYENVVVYNNVMGKVDLDRAVGLPARWKAEKRPSPGSD